MGNHTISQEKENPNPFTASPKVLKNVARVCSLHLYEFIVCEKKERFGN
jgi:hypothetical protein